MYKFWLSKGSVPIFVNLTQIRVSWRRNNQLENCFFITFCDAYQWALSWLVTDMGWCGQQWQCHLSMGAPGWYKKSRGVRETGENNTASSVFYGLCFNSCLHVLALSSFPGFPWWTCNQIHLYFQLAFSQCFITETEKGTNTEPKGIICKHCTIASWHLLISGFFLTIFRNEVIYKDNSKNYKIKQAISKIWKSKK